MRLARQLLKSREALRVQKDTLENLFQNSPEAIAFLDAEGMVVRVNRPFFELFGFTGEECRGRHLDDLLVPADRKEEASRITDRARRGLPTSFETVRTAKDGKRIDVQAQGVPVFSEGGKIGEYFLYRDIRDRKAAERALLANREDLKRSLQRMDRAWKQTVEVLSSTAEARDPYTAGHQRKVAQLAGAPSSTRTLWTPAFSCSGKSGSPSGSSRRSEVPGLCPCSPVHRLCEKWNLFDSPGFSYETGRA